MKSTTIFLFRRDSYSGSYEHLFFPMLVKGLSSTYYIDADLWFLSEHVFNQDLNWTGMWQWPKFVSLESHCF